MSNSCRWCGKELPHIKGHECEKCKKLIKQSVSVLTPFWDTLPLNGDEIEQLTKEIKRELRVRNGDVE